MIKTVEVFRPDIASRISSPEKTFNFIKGVNLLIGENGCGKSTLLNLIASGNEGISNGFFSITTHDNNAPFALRFIDMTKQGKNMQTSADDDSDKFLYAIVSKFKSSGEANIPVLLAFHKFKDGMLVIIDEPEQSLDFEHMLEFIEQLKRESNRINFIISTHNPLLINQSFVNCINLSKTKDYKERLMGAFRQ